MVDNGDGELPSAPWERPQRWEGVSGASAGEDRAPSEPRRRRYAEDGDGISASALISALRGGDAAAADDVAATGHTTDDPDEADLSADPATEPVFNITFPTDDDDPVDAAAAASGFGGGADFGGDGPWDGGPGGDDDGSGGDDDVQYVGPSGSDSRRHRAPWLVGRSVIGVIATLIFVYTGAYWVTLERADSTLQDNQVSALDPGDTNIIDGSPNDPGAPVTDANVAAPSGPTRAENILILGSDDRSSAEDQELGGTDDSHGGSDVVMIAHLSEDRSHVTVVSIPRDTYIPAPTCKAWDWDNNRQKDEDYPNQFSLWRINSTFAAGGPPCTVKAVQELTGLRIDRLIAIDFAGFVSVVDELGGIEVNACYPLIDKKLGTVLPVAGVQRIDGRQALDLVRARKVEGDPTSDLGRIKRQQKVLSSVLAEMMSAGTLLNLNKQSNVVDTFVSNVQQDNVTIESLLELARALGSLSTDRVTFFTLPTYADANGVGLHPKDSADLVWEALRNDVGLPGEVTSPVTPTTTTPPSTKTTPPVVLTTIPADPVTKTVTSVVTQTPQVPQRLSVEPSAVNLQIVNAANRPRVASVAQTALASQGFRVPDNLLLRADNEAQQGITVEYAPDNREAAVTVASAVPGATLVPVDGLGTRVRLVLGSSFDDATFADTLRDVTVGDAVPRDLSSSVTPVTETRTETVVTTPPPVVSTVPPSTTSTSSTSDTSTLASSDITSVNAGSAGCI